MATSPRQTIGQPNFPGTPQNVPGGRQGINPVYGPQATGLMPPASNRAGFGQPYSPQTMNLAAPPQSAQPSAARMPSAPPRQTPPGLGQVNVNRGAAPAFDLGAFNQFSDATYGEATRRLDPQFAQREANFRQDLVNRGISEGTEAYDKAFSNFSQDRNDAYGSARNQALVQALGAQQQFFGQDLSNRQFGEGQRQFDTGFGENQRQFDVGLGQRESEFGRQFGLAGQQFGEGQRQFNLGLGQRESEFGRQLGEGGRQFDVGMGQRESEFGRQFGEGRRQYDTGLGFQRERADFGDLMSLLGYGQQGTAANNASLSNDFNRGQALMGFIPNMNPQQASQVDVMGPLNTQYQRGVAQAQQNQASNQAAAQAAAQIGAAILICSREWKDEIRTIAPDEALAAITSVPLVEFSYKESVNGAPSMPLVGTYAEDWSRAFGRDPQPMIPLIEMLGALIGSVQALAAKVEALEER